MESTRESLLEGRILLLVLGWALGRLLSARGSQSTCNFSRARVLPSVQLLQPSAPAVHGLLSAQCLQHGWLLQHQALEVCVVSPGLSSCSTQRPTAPGGQSFSQKASDQPLWFTQAWWDPWDMGLSVLILGHAQTNHDKLVILRTEPLSWVVQASGETPPPRLSLKPRRQTQGLPAWHFSGPPARFGSQTWGLEAGALPWGHRLSPRHSSCSLHPLFLYHLGFPLLLTS